MRLSDSLKRGIMKSGVGGILNKFKIRSRRSTLFFEDIFSEYVMHCENNGKKKEMFNLAKKWASVSTQQLIPGWLKNVSDISVFNLAANNVWTNVGLVEYFDGKKDDDIVYVTTKREFLTRITGENEFMKGFFVGCVNGFFRKECDIVSSVQSRTECMYKIILRKEEFKIGAKDKKKYDTLNYLPAAIGFSLQDALKKNIFQLKEKNRIYFRKRPISPTENTIFHIISNEGPFLETVPEISFNYFKDILLKGEEKRMLSMLKTLLQCMGWGVVKILEDVSKIKIIIKSPPCGLQTEKENLVFIINVILGFLWTIDRRIVLGEWMESEKLIDAEFILHAKKASR
ncbi:MAG: hypothetical protein JW754_04890 [Candidatus Aenigmarchaeota archaeon]|nr:hypothetical protein [Candidatus Aenigmarchaeota archaeon]